MRKPPTTRSARPERRRSTGCDETGRAHFSGPTAAIGLPPGQMGNSEVGHLNIGAGRVVMQDLPRIAGRHRVGRDQDRAGADRPDRSAQETRRHLSHARAGLARRRAFAPGPRGGRWRKSSTTPRQDGHASVDRRRDTPPQSASEDCGGSWRRCRKGSRSRP